MNCVFCHSKLLTNGYDTNSHNCNQCNCLFFTNLNGEFFSIELHSKKSTRTFLDIYPFEMDIQYVIENKVICRLPIHWVTPNTLEQEIIRIKTLIPFL